MRGRMNLDSEWGAIDNAIVLFYMAVIWLCCALTGDPEAPAASILIFICGFALIKPLIRLLKNGLRSKKPVHANTQLLLSCLTLGTATGLVPVFFSFINNPIFFFIAFSAIQGFLMLAVWKSIGQISIIITGILLVVNAGYQFFNESSDFNHISLGAALICLFFSGYSRLQPILSRALSTSKRDKALSTGS